MLGLGLGDRVTLVIDATASVDVVVGGLYEAIRSIGPTGAETRSSSTRRPSHGTAGV
ncbi:hypothetical protein [Nonomuraea sp. NPDC048901]|uniref:hypothetical protein n=1 Tax=Nonomuraea sp. NPDC048901 TaxID=3155627 RepID=UPI0033C039C7